MGVLSVALGCGRPPAENPAAQPTRPAAEAAPETPEDPEEAARQAAILSELTQAVRRFAVEQRRRPGSLEEVAAQGYLTQVPVAPPGKAYAIDKNLQVYVADQ